MAVKQIHSAPPTTVEAVSISPRRTTIWLWLTAPITILLAIAGGSGVLVEDLYRDNPSLVAQAFGQDLITLAVALPALVISAIFAGRGSTRGRLVWLGVVAYVVYTYVTYAFGIRFNPLFLAYLALLAC